MKKILIWFKKCETVLLPLSIGICFAILFNFFTSQLQSEQFSLYIETLIFLPKLALSFVGMGIAGTLSVVEAACIKTVT